MYIALYPVRFHGKDYRVGDEIEEDAVQNSTHLLQAGILTRREDAPAFWAPIYEKGNVSCVPLEKQEAQAALIFLQMPAAAAIEQAKKTASVPLLDYLYRIEARKTVREALETALTVIDQDKTEEGL